MRSQPSHWRYPKRRPLKPLRELHTATLRALLAKRKGWRARRMKAGNGWGGWRIWDDYRERWVPHPPLRDEDALRAFLIAALPPPQYPAPGVPQRPD